MDPTAPLPVPLARPAQALTPLILGAGPAGSRDTAPLGGADRTPGRSGKPADSPWAKFLGKHGGGMAVLR